MIDIKHLAGNTERYKEELVRRGKNPELAVQAKENYDAWKEKKAELDQLLEEKNIFNKKLPTLSESEKALALEEMKTKSELMKSLESKVKQLQDTLTASIAKIPNLTWD